ncbi:MAG TPA: hypothetical protein VJU86_17990 [Pyrinomonadaceae bacterium]|nr:hypothetical protein [Pyrinomonadaceae bacterium]
MGRGALKLSQLEHETISLFLLGRLDQGRLAQVEERLMTEEGFYDELVIVEDELTDQYLANELSDADRVSFETHFLAAPERHEKLRFARCFQNYINEKATEPLKQGFTSDESPPQQITKSDENLVFMPARKNPIFTYAIAAVVLIAVVGIAWVAFRSARVAPSFPASVLTVPLTPGGLSRGSGELQLVPIPPATDQVELQLPLELDEYQDYRAELLNGKRETLIIKEGLKPETTAAHKIVKFIVPASLLKRDDYSVKLGGRRADESYESVQSFVFRVKD